MQRAAILIGVDRAGSMPPLDDLRLGHDDAADVIVRGAAADAAQLAFLAAVLGEASAAAKITDAQVRAAAGDAAIERGPMNWRWVRAVVQALDEHVEGASGTTLALVTADVWRYLTHPGTQTAIETGVERALRADAECVVVGHSLGSVVTYNMLRRAGEAAGWRVPLFVTVGSPLGVKAIRDALRPIARLSCVVRWLNAMDPNVVARRVYDAAIVRD